MQLQVRNPQYNAANTVDLEINHPQFGWVPFTATPYDAEAYGRELYAQAVAGDFGPVAEYVAPSPVQLTTPASVTMRQCRLQLLATGKLNLVAAAIASLPSPQKEEAEIEWEYGAVVWRSSSLIAMLAPVLGWNTAEEIDAQFIAAEKL